MSPSERALFAGLKAGSQLGGSALSAYKGATSEKPSEGMKEGESLFGYTKQPLDSSLSLSGNDNTAFLTGLSQGISQGGKEAPMLSMAPQQQQAMLPPVQPPPRQVLGDGTDLKTQLLLSQLINSSKLQY